MRKLAVLLPGLVVPCFAAQVYQHVPTTATVATSPVSRYVTLTVHLRNIGGIATACVVVAMHSIFVLFICDAI